MAVSVSCLTCRFSSITLLAIFLVFSQKIATGNINSAVHRRFEYKYSFKPPYLAQKDGTVPFWEYGGNAIASSENVRIVPSLRSQKGAMWSKSRTNFDWWEVDIVFRVTGRGRIGADGLAFWYTTEKGDYAGPVFGSSDKWSGLGLFFDSFDNDNKHNNPFIMAILNDGSKQYDHMVDGSTQQLAGCLRDFRNKPFPTRARIEYYKNVLTVMFHNGMTNNLQDYEMCFRAENVMLPKNGYFGISAATGGLADDHDVYHFLTTSLHIPGQLSGVNQMSDTDSHKLTEEYQEYQKNFDQQKQEYKEKHPELAKHDDDEDWFESENEREYRQMWQAFVKLNDAQKELSQKIDEVLGRQERTLGLLSVQPQVAGQVPPGGGAIQVTGTITRPEVDMILNNQNQLLATSREIRALVGEVHARADTILSNQARAPTAQVQASGFDVQSLIGEMRDGMNHVKLNMANMQRDAGGTGCPKQTCVSMTVFISVAVAQVFVILLYHIYKSRKEDHAKKFF